MTTIDAGTSLSVDIGGPVHYLDFGGPSDGPLVVGVHGLGGAAWNWLALAPLLTGSCRMLAVDLAGHGMTPAAGRSTSVPANRRLLERFLRAVAGEPVVLVGNSMGGLISALQAAATPDLVRGAVLVDPALPRPPLSPIDPRVAMQFALIALPGIGEAAIARHRQRQSPQQQMRETLALCAVDPSRIPAGVIAEGLRVAETRDADQFPPSDFLAAARSLVRILARPAPVRRRLARIQAPVLLLHGDRDRLVSLAVARAVARSFPTWRFEVARDTGHVPMLEAPDWTAAQILDWMRTEAAVL